MVDFGLGASVDATGGERRVWYRLTTAERAELTASGHVKVWPPGDILALQGSPPTSMFVILSGRVKIIATNQRGDGAPLGIRGRGEIVGELAPISGLPRTATIQAIDEVQALVVPGERLAAILARRPHILQQLFRAAAIRQQQSDRIRLESGGAEFHQRLAALLLDLAVQHVPEWAGDTPVTLPVTQGELADYARVSRSTLIRGLEELRRRGLVQTARNRITLLRPDELDDLAAGTAEDENK